MQAGTAPGELGEVRWDTIELQRRDMLVMVATGRHHGMPALPDSKDGLQGALFNLWTPNAKHRHNARPIPRTWTPPSPEALAVAGDLSGWDCPSVDQLLWVGKGVVWRVGLWEGAPGEALFADAPELVPAGSPTCPFHPTLLSRSAPSTDLAVMEIAEHSVLFFVGNVHQIEICKGDNVDAQSEIDFAISGVAHPVRPTTLWHLLNTALAWQLPKSSKAGPWSITCPHYCKVCLLVCLLPLLPNWTKFT